MSKKKIAGIIVVCIIVIIVIVVIATRPSGLPPLGPLGPKVSVDVDYEVTTHCPCTYFTARVEGPERQYSVVLTTNLEGEAVGQYIISPEEMTSGHKTVEFQMGCYETPIPGDYWLIVEDWTIDKRVFEAKLVFEGPDVSITNVQFEGGNFKYLGGTKVIAQVYNDGDLPAVMGHMKLLVAGLETSTEMWGRECLPPGETTVIEGTFHLGFLEHGTYPATLEIYSYREAAYYSERVKLASYETQVSG